MAVADDDDEAEDALRIIVPDELRIRGEGTFVPEEAVAAAKVAIVGIVAPLFLDTDAERRFLRVSDGSCVLSVAVVIAVEGVMGCGALGDLD